MACPLDVLIVDDSDDDAFLIAHTLQRAGYAADWWRVDDAAALHEALRRRHWDVVLCDSIMPRLSIVHAVRLVHGTAPQTPVIVVSGRRPEDLPDGVPPDEVSGFVGKDHLEDLPALLRALRLTAH